MIERKSRAGKLIGLGCIILFLAVVLLLDQIIKPTDYMSMLLKTMQMAAVYVIAAVSLNLLTGFTGLFSLGHAGFMLVGAYVYAIFTLPSTQRDFVYQYYDAAVKISFPEMLKNQLGGAGTVLGVLIAVLLAGVAAMIIAWLIGLPVLRLKSDYLAIATLGFAEVVRAVFQWGKLGPVTNGSNPIKSFVRLSAFKVKIGTFTLKMSTFIPVLIAIICIALIVLLINSSYGRAFKAIRENEIAAEAMGINLAKHKMLAFCASSFFAGVAGACMAMVSGIVQASNFKAAMTYEILLMVVLGGIGSVSGSVIGSMLYIAASLWWLRGLDTGKFLFIEAPGVFRNGFRLVIFSVVIMVVVLFFRRGIMGNKELPDLFKRKRKGAAK